MKYNIHEPWKTLDTWQKKYIEAKGNTFLLCGRQSGKSTAAAIKFSEKAAKDAKSCILMIAFTEKQAQRLFIKALTYIRSKYLHLLIEKGKDKPTQHRLKLRNGSEILCYAAGKTGLGLVGYTITDLVVDEAASMNRQIFTLLTPTLSVTGGHIHLLSTPRGKEGYFYECSLRDDFTKFYVNAEDCPRHTKEFLASEQSAMTRLEYAQEYRAEFLDEFKRLFPEDWITKVCTIKRGRATTGKLYLGMDIAGLGQDISSFEIIRKISNEKYEQVENFTTARTYTTQTSDRAVELHAQYKFRRIGVDDGGVGFGVFSELLNNDTTKGKVRALNNSSRATDNKDGKKKLLKEEMYFTLKFLGEQSKIKLLDDDEIIESLASVQWELVEREGFKKRIAIHGKNTHICEGIIRAVFLAYQDKVLNMWAI